MTGVLELEARAHHSRNGNEQIREVAMARARARARALAESGLSVNEIESRLGDGFNHTEREILWLIASHEVDRAARGLEGA